MPRPFDGRNRHRDNGVTIGVMSGFTVEVEKETDGRWIGEIPELPGVLAYGDTREKAVARAKALAFRVLADSPTEHDRQLHGSEV